MFDIVAVLDRSGSMSGDETKVIDAFNEFIESQKKAGHKARVSLFLFDDQYEAVFTDRDINEVQPLCEHVYWTRGMTALDDAIGKTIKSFNDRKNVFMFIETDGQENCSKEFTASITKSMIEEKKKVGWEFTFIGADLTERETKSMGNLRGLDNTLSIGKSEHDYGIRNVNLTNAVTAYASKVGSSEFDNA